MLTVCLHGMNTLPSPALTLIHWTVDLDILILVVCSEFHILSFIQCFLTISSCFFFFFSISNALCVCEHIQPVHMVSGVCLTALPGNFGHSTFFEVFLHSDHCFQLVLCHLGAFSTSLCMLNMFPQSLGHLTHPHPPLCPQTLDLVWLPDMAIAGKRVMPIWRSLLVDTGQVPCKIRSVFGWNRDWGHQPRNSFGPDGKYLAPSMQ